MQLTMEPAQLSRPPPVVATLSTIVQLRKFVVQADAPPPVWAELPAMMQFRIDEPLTAAGPQSAKPPPSTAELPRIKHCEIVPSTFQIPPPICEHWLFSITHWLIVAAVPNPRIPPPLLTRSLISAAERARR